jgi:quercetin dioxygenase-like cupin family protein
MSETRLSHVARDPRKAVAPIPPETLLDMASDLALVADAWACSLDQRPDARTGLRVLTTESYDVWLLRWPAGSTVSPHHHGESDAAFVVSAGALEESRWRDGNRMARRLMPGQGATVERGVVHDVGAQEDALSVHVYSPPLVHMAFFDDSAETVVLEKPVDPRNDAVFVGGPSSVAHSGGLEKVLEAVREGSPRSEPRDLTATVDLEALAAYTRPGEPPGRAGDEILSTQPRITALRVEDVIFLDDLRALGIPWIDRLVDPCTSHQDVERVWSLIRMWGGDHEDVKDLLQLSTQAHAVEREVQKMLDMIRLREDYQQ